MYHAWPKFLLIIFGGSFLSSCAEMACFDPSPGYNMDCASAKADKFNKRYKEYFQQQEADWRASANRQARKNAVNESNAIIKRGKVYYDQGQYEQAIAEFDNAIGVNSQSVWAYTFRGEAYKNLGRFDRALADFDKALTLDSTYAFAYWARGELYHFMKNYSRALADYTQAINRNANDARARNSKAWLLATAPNGAVRNGPEAVRLATEAVRLNDHAYYRDTLAAAYAENGQFSKAIEEMQRAIRMQRETGDLSRISEFNTHLQLFEQRQPYRE